MIQFQVRIQGKKMEKLRMEIDQLRREDVSALEIGIAEQMELLIARFGKEIGKQQGVMVEMKLVPKIDEKKLVPAEKP